MLVCKYKISEDVEDALRPVIALDLEGTLIQDQIYPRPRPHLYRFLDSCISFGRVVVYTTVDVEIFRRIAKMLVVAAHAPSWFVNVEYGNCHKHGKYIRSKLVVPEVNKWVTVNPQCPECFKYAQEQSLLGRSVIPERYWDCDFNNYHTTASPKQKAVLEDCHRYALACV